MVDGAATLNLDRIGGLGGLDMYLRIPQFAREFFLGLSACFIANRGVLIKLNMKDTKLLRSRDAAYD